MSNAGKTLLDPCAGSGGLLLYHMKKHGIDPRNTYYNDNDPIKYENFIHANRRYDFGIPEKNITCFDFLSWETDMNFDVVVGNPPYGKNANLAIKFLNKASFLSDKIFFILPKTMRKPSAFNRINDNLHLVFDKDNPDSTFGGGIFTMTQLWEVKDTPREKIKTKTTHVDFEFVSVDEANVIVGRVGAGPCGKVFTDGFDKRSPNSHYFIRAKNKSVIEKLKKMSSKLIEAGNTTVGCPSLSKDQLIKMYENTN